MISIILGTRAQLIKMAPVIRCLEDSNVRISFVLTGQHKTTISELIDDFGIRTLPIHAYIGCEIDSIAQVPIWFARTLASLIKLRKSLVCEGEHNMVLTHGDTFSTLLAVLAGKIMRAEVAHVESGLRSFNIFNPFPEELVRRIVFRLSDICYCPGAWATNNLKGMSCESIDTGENTILDNVREATLNRDDQSGDYCVYSIHRFENLYRNERIRALMEMVEISANNLKVVFVLHPPTKQRLKKLGLLDIILNNKDIVVQDRTIYSEFLRLLSGAEYVITDGGSNQEELSYLGVPTLLYRSHSERKEGLGKNVVLSEYKKERIVDFINNFGAYRMPFTVLSGKSPTEIIVTDLARRMERKINP